MVSAATIERAAETLASIISPTPLVRSKRLSKLYSAEIYLKREDLQEVRSYKIRGAYTLMSSFSPAERAHGVVCASAGNHAQGVAYSAAALHIKTIIFMPVVTPQQKIDRVKYFGEDWVQIKLYGKTYDETCHRAKDFCKKQKMVFVHPFEDYTVMAGQGTVGKEIFDQMEGNMDAIIVPIGGGGLASGLSTYIKHKSRAIQIYGAEPTGCAGMHCSLSKNEVTTLESIDTFADGVAVKTVGELTFPIVKRNIKKILLVSEQEICRTMIEMYQQDGIVTEPAGALSVAALTTMKKEIKGKTVVCIISGGNNDLARYPEIIRRSEGD